MQWPAHRGLAKSRVGTTTSRGGSTARRSDDLVGRDPPVPISMVDITLHVRGLGWHGPVLVVGAPPSSYGYASSRRLVAGAVASPTRAAAFLPRAASAWPRAQRTRAARACDACPVPGRSCASFDVPHGHQRTERRCAGGPKDERRGEPIDVTRNEGRRAGRAAPRVGRGRTSPGRTLLVRRRAVARGHARWPAVEPRNVSRTPFDGGAVEVITWTPAERP
jgi:hypothetical protein